MDDRKNDSDRAPRDAELDALLAGLESPAPSELETARWKAAVRREAARLQKPLFGLPAWATVAAALVIGFVAGAVSFSGGGTDSSAENHPSSATVEIIYAKSE